MKNILLVSVLFLSFYTHSQTIGLQSFATGFSSPVEIATAGDNRLFVVQQGGLIRIVNANGSVNGTPFINLSSLISTGGERGLLGLAFHPNYVTNGYFYVNYTNTAGNTVIARYSVSPDLNIANTTGTILLTIAQPYSNHNGGSLKFGPEGYLYIGMGDGGSGGDPGNRAQNINENLGKMLRIDVNSGSPYGIPPTNPYASTAGNDEIWAIGMRNPWKFSFNRLNGDLWIADVGQNAIEEVNKTTSPLPNTGLNFGWRCYEGSVAYNTTGCPPIGTMTFPFAEYVHGTTNRCSITGGYFYTGTTYPNFANKYFFADYCTAEIAMLDSAGTISWGYDAAGLITTFGEDINGELYVANGTAIYKIIDTSLETDNFSKTGLRIYPNPVKNEFFIKNSNEINLSKIQLADMTGKILLSQDIENTEVIAVPITNISSGIYLVLVEDASGNVYKSKLIIE
jgi:glucose/arabinose dehydrogenase